MGMTQSPESDFDFEEWALLAKTDPAAFEAKRKEAIAQLIADFIADEAERHRRRHAPDARAFTRAPMADRHGQVPCQ